MKWSDVSLCDDQYEYSIRVNQGVIRPNDIPALHAYCVLRDVFGPPNNTDFDDMKTQWSYYLQVPGAHVDVHDWRREVWSIAIYDDKATDIGKEYAALEARDATPEELHIAFGNLLRNNDNANALKIGNEFLELIKQRIPKVVGHAKKLSSNARSTILQHPFLTYYEDAVNLLQIARESPSDAAVHCKAAFFLFIASFEGLMNLVYELYARPDLRDDRLFERLSREQIDIKIRLAPLYCVCFLTTLIDSNSDVFRLFQSIINL